MTPIRSSLKRISASLVVFLQVTNIIGQPGDLVYRHPPFNAAENGVLLVIGEVMSGLRSNENEYLVEQSVLFGESVSAVYCRYVVEDRVLDVPDQLIRHLFGRKM